MLNYNFRTLYFDNFKTIEFVFYKSVILVGKTVIYIQSSIFLFPIFVFDKMYRIIRLQQNK